MVEFQCIAMNCFKILILSISLLITGSNSTPAQDIKEWTDTRFPSYIKRMNYFGERADWSIDGKRFLFVGRSFGDVYEMDVATGIITPLTHHYYHGGYVRALYLSNGDILLSGPKDFPGENWQEARFRLSELWILNKSLDKPAVRLGEYCWEGPSASRTQLRIAWAEHHGIYPSAKRLYQIWVADINYSSGKPELGNQRLVLDNSKGIVEGAVLEPQNFRPNNESELIVQSSNEGTEVLGLNIETGKLVNYSQSPNSYDEPEGIFPDGKYTLVESNRHNPEKRTGTNIDLWKLKLDGSTTWERITYFNVKGIFRASNPVVSDDGKFIAFQVPRIDEVAGIGHGIYILDIQKYEDGKKENSK